MRRRRLIALGLAIFSGGCARQSGSRVTTATTAFVVSMLGAMVACLKTGKGSGR